MDEPTPTSAQPHIAQSNPTTLKNLRGDMVVNPPYVDVVVETLDENNKDIPSELVGEREGRLMVKYLRYNGSPLQDLISSFDEYVTTELPEQIAARSLQIRSNRIAIDPAVLEGLGLSQHGTLDFRVTYTNVMMEKPMYTADGVELNFYPENARRMRQHYWGAVTATPTLYLYNSYHNVHAKIANMDPVVIMYIPIMTGSEKCHLRDVRNIEDFLRLGEDPYLALGHFIIGGSEKCIINTELLRYNRIYVFPPSKSVKNVHCRMTVPHPTGTKQMQVTFSSTNPGEVILQLGVFKKDPKSKETRGINVIHVVDILDQLFPRYNSKGVMQPKFSELSRQINERSPQHMRARMNIPVFRDVVLKSVPANERNSILALFSVTEERYNQASDYEVLIDICRWMMLDVKDGNLQNNAVQLRSVFAEQFFPHVPMERTYVKIALLANMTARLLRVSAGYIGLDNMNDWANKQIKTPGKMIAMLVRGLWRNTIADAQKKIDNDRNMGTIATVPQLLKHAVSLVQTKEISEKIITSFNSINYGSRDSQVRQNITYPCDSVTNIIDSLSIKTKIDVHIDHQVKSPQIRGVHPAQLGIICPAKTPDDQACGIVKNKAISARITTDVSRPAIEILKLPEQPGSPLYGTEVGNATISVRCDEQHPHILLVNCIFEGWCNSELLYHRCVSLRRRRNVIHQDTELVRTRHHTLEIYTDAGRILRPLLVVSPNGGLALDEDLGARDLPFEELLRRGYVEYIGSAEAEKLIVACSPNTLTLRLNEISALKQVLDEHRTRLQEYTEMMEDGSGENQRLIADTERSIQLAERNLKQALIPYDYAEIHPVSMMGIAASLMPFLASNQACRISYQAKMFGQAMSTEPLNPYRHRGPTLHTAYPNLPFVETSLDHYYGLHSRPIGTNAIVAVCALFGDNQEDSVIMNKASVDAGMFTYVRTFIYDTVVMSMTGTYMQVLKKPVFTAGDNEAYRYITNDGLPMIGAVMKKSYCVIGKTQINTADGTEIDVSEYMRIGEEGIVDDIRITQDKHGMHVSVRIRSYRIPELGDKFTPRYSQKTTIGRIVNREDMPFTEDGMTPDLIINPHSLPSRMTMGYISEIILGTAAMLEGKTYDATAFQPYKRDNYERILRENGFQSRGYYRMMNGHTGKLMPALIFTGVTHFQQLIHISRDKVQSRAKGQVNLVTRQPTKGRLNGGAVRFGQMEGDSSKEHGAAHFLHERMCRQADEFPIALCYNCGTIASYNSVKRVFECPLRCSPESRVGMTQIPYTFKLLMQYMGSVGIKFKPELAVEDEYIRLMGEKAAKASAAAAQENEEYTAVYEEGEEGEEGKEEGEEEPEEGKEEGEEEEGMVPQNKPAEVAEYSQYDEGYGDDMGMGGYDEDY